jgi:hypothetical protein
MKTISIVILILWASIGCSSFKEVNSSLPPEYVALKVPLESNQGQVALSCIQYWSETCMRGDMGLRFVPLSEHQIAKVRSLFAHSLAPGARAKSSDRYPQVVDRSTNERGIAVGIYRLTITANEAEAFLETTSRFGKSGYIINLVKTNADWRVWSHTNVYAPGVFHWKIDH